MTSKFTVTQHKGFRLAFENGWEVSVQWGVMNYCTAQNYSAPADIAKAKVFWESTTAECAVFNPAGAMVPLSDYDKVKGWMTADEVATLINQVATGTFVPNPNYKKWPDGGGCSGTNDGDPATDQE